MATVFGAGDYPGSAAPTVLRELRVRRMFRKTTLHVNGNFRTLTTCNDPSHPLPGSEEETFTEKTGGEATGMVFYRVCRLGVGILPLSPFASGRTEPRRMCFIVSA